MPKKIAKKGFIHYITNKKWKPTDILEPFLAVPFAYITLRLMAEGVTPLNTVITLAGLAYLTILFRIYRRK
jgi:hypothetical protein